MSAAFAENSPSATDPMPDTPRPLPTVDQPRKLHYFAAFRYLFDSPERVQTLLFGSVCLLIPVFGNVALVGYYYEIVELLHRDRAAKCPPFEFRRFALYCARGVWTYLLLLAILSVLQPVLQIPLQYTLIGVMIAFQSSTNTGAIVAAIAGVVWLGIAFGVWMLMMFFYQPLGLRGGLSQDLGRMFRLRWVWSYDRKIWLPLVLASLLILAASCILLPLGLLVMFVGVLPVTVWLTVAGAHLTWQLYELFLELGGEPVPLKPAEADVPPVVGPVEAVEGKA